MPQDLSAADLASMNDNHHREFKLKLGKVQAMAISGDTSGALQEAAQAEKALALRMDVMKEVIHEEEVKMTARAGTPRNAAPTPPPLLGKKGSVGRVQNSGIALGRAMPSGARHPFLHSPPPTPSSSCSSSSTGRTATRRCCACSPPRCQAKCAASRTRAS